MKKVLLGIGILMLVGAGCAPAGNAPKAPEQQSGAQSSAKHASGAGLQPLPEAKAPKTPIDDSAWAKLATKAGITVSYPTKGGFSPQWNYQPLAADDSHLKGTCYVTADTSYERTSVPGYDDACQTATTVDGSAAGTRIDYFVFRKDGRVNLFTFTKDHPAGFDMDEYAATLDRIISDLQTAPKPAALSYIVSDKDPNAYCNGADMDSEGYRQTITDKKPLPDAAGLATPAEQVAATLKAAAGERCQQVLEAVKDGIKVENGVAIMPPVEGWAGVSIALCSCKPLFEANALNVPGVSKVVWQ